MIVVIDYGMGNLGSILNMLKKVGAEARISEGPEDLLLASKLILPGVGAFDAGISNLRQRGYLDVLDRRVRQDKVPILGICLGMQLFSRFSEEGKKPGLGWIDAQTVRFRMPDSARRRKVPHMGWNAVAVQKPSVFFEDAVPSRRFYFVHSYHVRCQNEVDVLTTTSYGVDFTSAVLHGNIVGCQFHPEKSHQFGMAFLRQFAHKFLADRQAAPIETSARTRAA